MFLMKDNKITPAQAKVSSSPSYTLAELWDLMKKYVADLEKKSGQYDTMMRLDLSAFHEWLAKREREVGDAGE